MALAMSAGDTWGISGPAFLAAYLLLAAAVWITTVRVRHGLAGGRHDRLAGDPVARPHDVAYLNRGADLAVTSALTAMHLTGTVVSVNGRIHAVGRLEPGADALERAIHFAAGVPVPHARLPRQRIVRTAVDSIDARLVEHGLLLTENQRRQIRAVGWWLVAVAGLGLVRLLAAVAQGEPVGLLVVALLLVSAVALGQLTVAPRRSLAGDLLLARLREEHHELDPTHRPDQAVYSPASAALGIGIFGTSALWASDPAFAEELTVQYAGGSDGGTFAGGTFTDGAFGDGGGCGDGGGDG